LTINLCALFIRVTDCSIRVSRSFTAGLQSPCPPGCYTYMIVIMKCYNIAAQPYLLLLVNPFILHQNNCNAYPTYVFIVWKEDASLPAMFNLLCSSTNQQLLKKNFCNQSSHYENYGQFNGSHHMPTTKLTLFVVNKDKWYTKEGRAKSMKNGL